MFLTRSIRRKMVLGLALVLGMLGILSAACILGLRSYDKVVGDLDYSLNGLPRQMDILNAMLAVSDSIMAEHAPGHRGLPVAGGHGELKEKLAQVRSEIRDAQAKLQNLRPSHDMVIWSQVTSRQLADLDLGLVQLERMQDASGDAAALRKMCGLVQLLVKRARSISDPPIGLARKLQDARRDYRARLRLVVAAALIVFVLLLGLVRCGYRWIFLPIRQLHQGARRVAQYDFDYRVQLKSNDEMAELADAFNQMTARFQQIKGDLDGQVRDRSRQLVRSERLAGVGFLAAGVAHEINNPLAAISMAAESLQERVEPLLQHTDEAEARIVRTYLPMIQTEAGRCRDITARLLDFSRGQDATRSQNDLTSIIAEVITMVGSMSKFRDRRIEFRETRPCYLDVNGPEIKQVVLNLVANALESMQSGGVLKIAILPQHDQVILSFTDDGCGMTPETIENLFEPFFTQKLTGKGTGLGLSISQRIVADHGGSIEATSQGPGTGSLFCVRLPRQANARAA